MKTRKILYPALFLFAATTLTACFDDDNTDYTEWREENTAYFEQMKVKEENGKLFYEAYAPEWSPTSTILIHWHNDRRLTASSLIPMSNSTIDIKYSAKLIDGTEVDNSYGNTVYGDSIYRSKPNANIIGMEALLTNMHVGDSVTCVMPATVAYGNVQKGSIKPYSTLVFDVKLVDIVAWEKPAKR